MAEIATIADDLLRTGTVRYQSAAGAARNTFVLLTNGHVQVIERGPLYDETSELAYSEFIARIEAGSWWGACAELARRKEPQ